MSDRPAMPDNDRAQKAAWVERVLGITIAPSGPAPDASGGNHEAALKGMDALEEPLEVPAPPAPPPQPKQQTTSSDAAALVKELSTLARRIAALPPNIDATVKARLVKLAADANVSIKTNDLNSAANFIAQLGEALRDGLDAAGVGVGPAIAPNRADGGSPTLSGMAAGIDNSTAAPEAHSGVVAIEPGASKKQEMLQAKKQLLEKLHETSGPDLSAGGVQRTADAAKRFVQKIESALSILETADEELEEGCGKLREDTEKFEPVEGANAAGEAKKLLDRAEKLLERALAALGAMTEKSAGEMIGKAEAAEKAVTSTLMDLAKSYGFEPIGLDYRLKSLKSLKEKLSRDMIEEGKPLEQVAKNVSDVLRYTASFPSEKLADGAEGVLKDLESKGYKVVKLKNTWPDEKISYKGINAQLMTPDGQKMELQFHTPDSFWLKDEGTHDLYEQMRRPDISKQRKGQLDNIQAEMARHLDKPPGIDKIKNVVIQT